MAEEDKRPIVIKKITKKAEGHHGGAWKVAYADFVTAMMAFFLLMWLLNATTEEQRRGISNYFGPAGTAVGSGGSGGFLGGQSLKQEGNFDESQASSPFDTRHVSDTSDDKVDESRDLLKEKETKPHPFKHENKRAFEKTQKEREMEKKEEKIFKEVEQEIRQSIQKMPALKDLAKNLIIDTTPEGLRIQIIDQSKYAMFPNGSSDMYPYTRQLLDQVVKVVKKLPNNISITGHTDAKRFANTSSYSNWELSADRANATRRAFLDLGLEESRISHVVGKAYKDPLIKQNPLSEQNRRISIVLLRQNES